MKISRLLSFILLLFCFNELKAGKIERAFEALGKYDYFGAKELFEKVKDKEPVAAPYGLSIIFGRNDNPFFNLDSAYIYLTRAENTYPKVEEKDKVDLQELGITDSTINLWKDSIDLMCWQQAREEHTEAAYVEFISRNQDADQLPNAIKYRNELAFQEAREINSSRAYKKFMEKYPQANQYYEAQNRYEARLFEESTHQGNLLAYENFIKHYPQSPYVREAQDSIYSISTSARTIAVYENFIRNYPENPNTERAWRNIYQLFTSDYSPQRIIEFRIEYPEYPFLEELMTDMKLATKIFFPFQKDGKFGFMDEEGAMMVEPKYEVVEPYQEGLALVVKEGKVGFINKSAELSIPFEYDDGESFNKGLAIVARGEKYGMIDRTNKAVVPLKYDLVGNFYSDLALVANDTAYGYVNRNGQETVPMKLEYATDFQNGYAVVDQDGKKGIINTLGMVVVPSRYNWLENYNQYLVCRAKQDSLYGLLDNKGAEILPFEYDRIGEFNDSLAMVVKGDKYGYVNAKGEIQIPLKYDFKTEALVWGKFENGYVKFLKKDKYGIMDTTGEEIFPAIFQDVGEYSAKEYVAVKKRGKWGYSDQNLKLTLSYKYELSHTFKAGIGKVKSEEGWQMINEDGKTLLDSAAQEIEYADSLIMIKYESGWALFDQELNTLLPPKYEKPTPFKYHFLRLKQGDEFTYFDLKKKRIIGLKE